MKDQITTEIRQMRETHAGRFNYDVYAILHGSYCKWTMRLNATAPAIAAIIFFFLPIASAADLGCYVSTGDNDWLWTSPPVNSQASIEAVFESLHKVFGVDRIYWRGSHAEWMLDHMIARQEDFQGYAFWQWERFLIKDKGQTDIAIRAARKRGMEIWGMNPLFDHGAQARSDSAKVGTPSVIELKLRVEHPEFVPIDRYGIRRQAGPVEFAYPEVRQTLIAQYVDLMTRRGYDGLMFYTYVEHCSMRFEDEYGFNQPIVSEFKRRYGQDIRRETFDKHAWARLRGEYVTQFLRELHAAFKKHGKKLGVAIDPQNTHIPAPWLCIERDLHPAGRIYMDWERWVREGIVDEIMVYCNGPLEKALNDVLAVTKGTHCSVSTIHDAWLAHHRHFGRAGVRRVVCCSYEYIEWGYKEEQPASAINSPDFLRRLRVLRQVAEKKTDLPLKKIMAATRDPNVLVRRQALRTLAALDAESAIPTIEAALNDTETGVRCMAVTALCELNRDGTVAKIFEAVRKQSSFQFENAVVSCLANMPAERTSEILKGCEDPNPIVRRVTVYALGRGRRRDEAVPHLIKALNDPDPYVRYCAANGLHRFAARTDVADALLAHLNDPHVSVRNRVALALVPCFQSKSRWISARQLAAVRALTKCFSQFGETGDKADADWSFRPVGNALLALGPRGREALQRFMDQREDKQLADFAWRILYVPQSGWRYSRCTEQEAEEGYRHHPILNGWKPVRHSATPPEPKRMPYLHQSFDSFEPYAKGKIGDYLHERGQWRTLGDAPPEPIIQEEVKRGTTGRSLRLTRGPAGVRHNVEGLRADYWLTTEHAIIEFWVYRATVQSSFTATWKDSGSGHWYIGVYVAPGGRVSVVTKDMTWTKTDANMPHGSWQRVHFEVDGKNLRYSVGIGSKQLTLVRQGIPIPPNQRYNILTISPQPPEGGISYLDDVSVTVPNPAR